MTSTFSDVSDAGGVEVSPVITGVSGRLIPLRETLGPLGLCRDTAYKLLAAGEFPVPALKVGRRWFVRGAQLDAFLAGA